MTQDPTILPYVSGTTLRPPRLIGIYILGSLGILIAIVLLFDGIIQGGNVGTVYETPVDRRLSASLLLAGVILFLASLAAVLWVLLARRIVLGLHVAAVLCQLPAVLQTVVVVATFKPVGNDWGGNSLNLVGYYFTLVVLAVAIGLAVAQLIYLCLPKVRGAFAARRG